MKQVQIPESLFYALLRYHWMDDHSEEQYIRDALRKKVDAMAKRQEYKDALGNKITAP